MTHHVTLAEARQVIQTELAATTARCRALNLVDAALAHVASDGTVDPDEALGVLRELLVPAGALRAFTAPAIDSSAQATDQAQLRQALETEILPRLTARLHDEEAPLDTVTHPCGSGDPLPCVVTVTAPPVPEPAPETRRDVEADEAILTFLTLGHKTVPQLAKLLKKRGEELPKVVDRTRVRVARLVQECKVLRIQRGLYAIASPPTRPIRREPELEVAWNGSMKTPLCAANGGLGSALGGLIP